jgi:hypothetical protein
MTVIIVRGGRGSGKTFLVRKVLACADRNDPYTERIDQTLLPQPRPTRESKDVKLGHILNNGRVFVVVAETGFNGAIAHLAIWNRLLTQDEIDSMWTQGSTDLARGTDVARFHSTRPVRQSGD